MNVLSAFQVMGGEPFCFTPDRIGKLTDYQIWDVYIRPAIKRNQPKKRKNKNDRYGGFPTRDEFIQGGAMLGANAEDCAREYDNWARTEEGRYWCAIRARDEARKEVDHME